MELLTLTGLDRVELYKIVRLVSLNVLQAVLSLDTTRHTTEITAYQCSKTKSAKIYHIHTTDKTSSQFVTITTLLQHSQVKQVALLIEFAFHNGCEMFALGMRVCSDVV